MLGEDDIGLGTCKKNDHDVASVAPTSYMGACADGSACEMDLSAIQKRFDPIIALLLSFWCSFALAMLAKTILIWAEARETAAVSHRARNHLRSAV